MRKIFLLIAFLLISGIALADTNILLNPSFEETRVISPAAVISATRSIIVGFGIRTASGNGLTHGNATFFNIHLNGTGISYPATMPSDQSWQQNQSNDFITVDLGNNWSGSLNDLTGSPSSAATVNLTIQNGNLTLSGKDAGGQNGDVTAWAKFNTTLVNSSWIFSYSFNYSMTFDSNEADNSGICTGLIFYDENGTVLYAVKHMLAGVSPNCFFTNQSTNFNKVLFDQNVFESGASFNESGTANFNMTDLIFSSVSPKNWFLNNGACADCNIDSTVWENASVLDSIDGTRSANISDTAFGSYGQIIQQNTFNLNDTPFTLQLYYKTSSLADGTEIYIAGSDAEFDVQVEGDTITYCQFDNCTLENATGEWKKITAISLANTTNSTDWIIFGIYYDADSMPNSILFDNLTLTIPEQAQPQQPEQPHLTGATRAVVNLTPLFFGIIALLAGVELAFYGVKKEETEVMIAGFIFFLFGVVLIVALSQVVSTL